VSEVIGGGGYSSSEVTEGWGHGLATAKAAGKGPLPQPAGGGHPRWCSAVGARAPYLSFCSLGHATSRAPRCRYASNRWALAAAYRAQILDPSTEPRVRLRVSTWEGYSDARVAETPAV